ncbi:MAG: hypothetical protein JWP01_1425 [Myxococcales bacterium]|nr:hypothetical protein [Myxococcales bacterium]
MPPGEVPPSPVPQPAPIAEPPAPLPTVQAEPAPVTVTPLVEVMPPLPEPELEPEPEKPKLHRNFAGSIQLDYMAVPTETTGRKIALDGATAEVSLKLAMDFTNKISANVKMCVACHGVEVGMAYFDLRVSDELNVRVGRFTPAFGEFPVRHDPANHRTSDKPLPYDMGRMLRVNEWNEGVLPAPWVDNGIEVNGTHFFGKHVQADYAVYAISGPRAGADPMDFDFKQSRSGESYYIDNNSRPVFGGQFVASIVTDDTSTSLGVSTMRGTYDPDHKLPFSIWAAHAVVRVKDVFLRAEYLSRRTAMSLGEDPMTRFRYGPGANGTFDRFFVKDGFYGELEVPAGKYLTLVAREDGLRRRGNVAMTSELRSESMVLRHTAAIAITLRASLRLKASYEYYDFSDFEDESVVHTGIAGQF